MPDALIKALSEKSGKSIEEIEKIWVKKKEEFKGRKIGDISFPKNESEWTDRNWRYLVGALKRILKIDSSISFLREIFDCFVNVSKGE